ncbi:hypothetical protein N0V90_009183 [Kalmusia sp. IMI 367209]|nr:hypothetical protein N0V90_009183 [Kalmusia sp. IMI 367209]
MPPTHIALAGATGNLGRPILAALLTADYEVAVLSRIRSSASSTLHPHPNLTIKEVDFTSVTSLASALNGVGVVISCLATSAIGSQSPLIDAAVAAGVSRFVPAEFGMDSLNELCVRLPVCMPKAETQRYLAAKVRENPGFSWTAIANGLFLDWCLKEGIILDLKEHSATLYNGGDVPFSTTVLNDVAKAVIGVIEYQEETANRVVYVHTAVVTQNQLLQYAVQKDGRAWKTDMKDTEELRQECLAELAKGDGCDVGEAMLGFCIWIKQAKRKASDPRPEMSNSPAQESSIANIDGRRRVKNSHVPRNDQRVANADANEESEALGCLPSGGSEASTEGGSRTGTPTARTEPSEDAFKRLANHVFQRISEDEELDGISELVCMQTALMHIQKLRQRQVPNSTGVSIDLNLPPKFTREYVDLESRVYWAAIIWDTSNSLAANLRTSLTSGLNGACAEPAWRLARAFLVGSVASETEGWLKHAFDVNDEKASRIICAASVCQVYLWKNVTSLKEALREGVNEDTVLFVWKALLDSVNIFRASIRPLLGLCQRKIHFLAQVNRFNWYQVNLRYYMGILTLADELELAQRSDLLQQLLEFRHEVEHESFNVLQTGIDSVYCIPKLDESLQLSAGVGTATSCLTEPIGASFIAIDAFPQNVVSMVRLLLRSISQKYQKGKISADIFIHLSSILHDALEQLPGSSKMVQSATNDFQASRNEACVR